MEIRLGIDRLIVAYGCTYEEGMYRGYVKFKTPDDGGDDLEVRCEAMRETATHAFNDALILAVQYRQ